jgi:hypothetical protein
VFNKQRASGNRLFIEIGPNGLIYKTRITSSCLMEGLQQANNIMSSTIEFKGISIPVCSKLTLGACELKHPQEG